jgi:hypothetical protein
VLLLSPASDLMEIGSFTGKRGAFCTSAYRDRTALAEPLAELADSLDINRRLHGRISPRKLPKSLTFKA